MNESQWEKERRGYEALSKLMADAQSIRDLFESASLPVPQPLARLFGEVTNATNGRGASPHVVSVRIPRPQGVPAEADDEWIWVPVKDLTPTALLLAVLRGKTHAVPSKTVIEELSAIRKGLNPGSVFNIAARLSGIIERSDDGWKIKDSSLAPLISGDHAWGPASIFGKHELAAHRRMLVEYVLAANPSGLQVMQILSQLEYCPQRRAPITKELVQNDVNCMQKEGKVRRRGNSKKWELVEQQKTDQ